MRWVALLGKHVIRANICIITCLTCGASKIHNTIWDFTLYSITLSIKRLKISALQRSYMNCTVIILISAWSVWCIYQFHDLHMQLWYKAKILFGMTYTIYEVREFLCLLGNKHSNNYLIIYGAYRNQIFFPTGMLLYEICNNPYMNTQYLHFLFPF